MTNREKLPSQVSSKVSWFDKFADTMSKVVSKAWFFLFSVVLVIVWGPSGFLIGFEDTWQLIINTTTTILTFLLVALLQNSQERSTKALHQKLNALAEGLSVLVKEQGSSSEELEEAVGVEEKEST